MRIKEEVGVRQTGQLRARRASCAHSEHMIRCPQGTRATSSATSSVQMWHSNTGGAEGPGAGAAEGPPSAGSSGSGGGWAWGRRCSRCARRRTCTRRRGAGCASSTARWIQAPEHVQPMPVTRCTSKNIVPGGDGSAPLNRPSHGCEKNCVEAAEAEAPAASSAHAIAHRDSLPPLRYNRGVTPAGRQQGRAGFIQH